MNTGNRIQSLRKKAGLSQKDLAAKVKVSRQAVSKRESGQSSPDIEKIITMSELFEVTTDFILKGEEPASTVSEKTIQSLYAGFAVLFAVIAGIWSFTANRFRTDECYLIMLAAAAAGCAAALLVQVLSSLFRKE